MRPASPPKLAERLLGWCAAPQRRAEAADDLADLFALRLRQQGVRRARHAYWADVLSICRRRALRRPRPGWPAREAGQLAEVFQNAVGVHVATGVRAPSDLRTKRPCPGWVTISPRS